MTPKSAAEIIVPQNRQRQAFDPASILELAQSIKQHGLFHAVQLRRDGQTLVSGERRLRAIREHLLPLGQRIYYNGDLLPLGFIPTVEAKSDDPLDLKEVELHENLVRRDLSWQEHAKATAELHELRSQQKVRDALVSGATTIPPQTWGDTAAEIGAVTSTSQAMDVRTEILVAAHMDKPEVAKAPDLKSAFKALKKIEDAERNRALAIAVGETFSAADHKVYQADCLEWMALPENQNRFDVILTDPPYGMNAQDFGDAGGKMAGIEHDYDDSYESWVLLMEKWAELSFAVTKAQAHAYVFCDIDRFHELKHFMAAAGWYVFRTPLTNYKQDSGRVPLPDMGPRRQSEWCLYAIKGQKRTNMIASDVIVTGADEQLSHGAQKPVALYDNLLRRSVRPGDSVLDTFAGTGTILAAAHPLKCKAVAVEKNPTYYGLCLNRLMGLDTTQEEMAV